MHDENRGTMLKIPAKAMIQAALAVVIGGGLGFAALAALGPGASPEANEAAAPAAELGFSTPPADVVVPAGMVYVPGGDVHVGSQEGSPDEQPVFRAEVEPFFLDRRPVTVAEFRRFVEASGYVTEAEKFGDAGVFDSETGAWRLVADADWRRPLGPDGPAAPDDHPVTQVSWNDAVAYARWAGKRLPTEIEWEHAARNGRDDRSRYAWGDQLRAGGLAHANTWEGEFPVHNSGSDGYLNTSPVGAYGETPLGLTDIGGNVWEWTADWYRPYAEHAQPFTATVSSEKVQRGGSFLCHSDYCHGYRVSARSHSTPETALFHVGFRTARDVEGA